jgi:GH24 family phage-related lysozyme (muramidase)
MAAFDGTLRTRAEEAMRIAKVKLPGWIDGVTIHAVSAPTMRQARETPYTQGSRMAKGPDLDKAFAQRLRNMKTRVNQIGGKGWHVTVFENGKFGEGCALHQQGSHASSWNDETLGLEMCFDGDSSDPLTEGGKTIMDSAAWWTAQILKARGLPVSANTVRYHRMETAARKKGKTCPGRNVNEKALTDKVKHYMGEPVVDLTPELPLVGTVKETQERLKAHGFDPGPIDGKWGPKTRSAVLDFQRKLGLSWKPTLEKAAYASLVGPYTYHRLTQEPASAGILTPPVAPPKPDVPVLVPFPPIKWTQEAADKATAEPVLPPLPQPPSGQIPVKDLHPSEFAIDWMKRFEGLRTTAYDDVGSWAIGYGHNATSGRPPTPYKGMVISPAEANKILHRDAEAIAAEVRKVLKGWAFTQDQFDALVLNCFQLGQTSFTKNRATKAIKANGTDKEVYDQLVAQANATPNAGLKRRRLVQAQIWNGEKPTKW